MNRYVKTAALLLLLLTSRASFAQTDLDAILMEKKQLCIGPMYTHISWKNYWEGTLKRDNENLGTVTTQSYSLMGAYGITNKLNVLAAAPYIKTKASAGTLLGMQGVQDLSLFVKWLAVEKKCGPGIFALYTIGGVSFPLTNYVADFLPLSIGLRSKTASARLMVDYDINSWFVTASVTYVLRDNIKIDRTAYYTTEAHLSNEVEMPDASNANLRIGYRTSKIVAEAVLNKWRSLGGFDITRNNMPFPSNKMNATTIGANFKYTVTPKHNFFLMGGGNTTVSGRNMGQAAAFYGGIFYVLDFSPKKSSSSIQPVKK